MSSQDVKLVDYSLAAAQHLIETFGRSTNYEAERSARGFVESLGGDFDRLNHPCVSPYSAAAYLSALVFRAAAVRDQDDKK